MSAAPRRLDLPGRWLDFWFAPAAARALGLCRIAFYGLLLVYYWGYDFRAWARTPASFWDPTAAFLILGLPRVSYDALGWMQFAWKAALLLACLGLATRLATASVFALGLYLIGYVRSIGSGHTDAALMVALGIMALARCGDACALDRWRVGRGARPHPAPTGDYRWPLRLLQVLTVLPLFAAGIAKLRYSGLEWVFSDTLAIVLLQSAQHATFPDPATGWGIALSRYGWLCRCLAAGALLIELLAPLALFSARARVVLVPSAALMLIGFRLLLGPNFAPLLICYACWVPWDRLADFLARRLPRPRPARTNDEGAAYAAHSDPASLTTGD